MNDIISRSINPDGAVTGGSREGTNLFYSFTEFSMPVDEEIFFTDMEDVSNIFISVTGNSPTEINGLINSENDTNLFLINPRGIIFREGTSLDIDGDFFGSTADSILFPDDISFSVSDSEPETLLSSDIPIGLGFGDTPTTIELNLNSENVESFGDNLTLVGGDINISNSKLFSETITLGSLGDSGILNIEGSNLIFPEDVAKGDINITAGSQLIVTGDGGSFQLDAENLTLDDTSEIIGEVDNLQQAIDTAEQIFGKDFDGNDVIGNQTEVS